MTLVLWDGALASGHSSVLEPPTHGLPLSLSSSTAFKHESLPPSLNNNKVCSQSLPFPSQFSSLEGNQLFTHYLHLVTFPELCNSSKSGSAIAVLPNCSDRSHHGKSRLLASVLYPPLSASLPLTMSLAL